MMYNAFTKKLAYLLIPGFTVLFCMAGCQSKPDKLKTDRQVYNIIDEKWQENFGSKTNYRIDDAQPAPDAIVVENAIPLSGILTLPRAVAIATAHSRQYKLEKEALYLKALDLRLARYEFETQFFGRATGDYSRSRGGENEEIASKAALGFNRLLASGAAITTKVTAAWVDILTGNYQSGLTSIFKAAITQPLLRGSDPKIVQEDLTQSERDMVYQIRTFNRFRKTFVVDIITRYYQLLQLWDIVKNSENNYDTLITVYNRAEKLTTAGRLPQFELEQARQDKLKAHDTLVKAKKNYNQTLDEFKLALSLSIRTEFQLDPNELKAIKATQLTMPDFSETDVIKTALIQRLDLANQGDAINDAERKILVAADNLRATLNLIAATNLSTDTSTDLTTLRTAKFSDIVGLQLDLPLDKLPEHNEYRKTLIALAQRQRDYEEGMDTVVLQVRQAYRDLTEAAERHRIQLQALELARKRFDNTFLLLRYARANTRDVLDAQDDLFDAQNDATTALINHAIAMLNFYRDAGVLQIQPDGMWNL